MRAHVDAVENAAGVAGLGRLSDGAALAVLRSRQGLLEAPDREALEAGRLLLQRLLEFSGTTLPPTSTLRSMNSFGLMDEAFGAACDRTGTNEDITEVVRGLVASINSILQSNASDDDAESVYGFFNQLAEVTLARSTELARPRRESKFQWASKAAGFSIS